MSTIFIAVALLLLASLLKNASADRGPRLASKPFLTARESAMLAAIEAILPDHRIHAQVAMGALIRVAKTEGRRTSPADRNGFSQKIVDFVVQCRATGEVVALVEVDDRSHRATADQARDLMTAQAGYMTIRIPAHVKPNLEDVRVSLGWLAVASDRQNASVRAATTEA